MPLALFDLDHTLINGDSDYGWGQFLVTKGVVDRTTYETKNEQFYRDYQAGRLNAVTYLEFALAPLTRLNREQRELLQREFMATVIAPMWQPKAEALVQQHRDAGDRLLVITSTNRFVVEPICQRFGISEIIASEPEMIDGEYTGKVVGVPSFQAGKVMRLHEWLQQTGESLLGSVFYSDSINDLPLLLEVETPVAVDPDEKLQAEAERQGWQIISLRD